MLIHAIVKSREGKLGLLSYRIQSSTKSQKIRSDIVITIIPRMIVAMSSLVTFDRLSTWAQDVAMECEARPSLAPIKADPVAPIGLITQKGINLLSSVYRIPFPEYPFDI